MEEELREYDRCESLPISLLKTNGSPYDVGKSTLENYEKSMSFKNHSSSMSRKSCLKKSITNVTFSSQQKTEEDDAYCSDEKRIDKFGTEIVNGGKKHRISFKKKLTLVKEVESYKKYNLEMSLAERACSCYII